MNRRGFKWRLQVGRRWALAVLVSGVCTLPAIGPPWLGPGSAAGAAPLAPAAKLKAQAAKTSVDPKAKHPAAVPASDFGLSQIALVNQQIREGWKAHELSPAPPATDGEFCRRLFLDLMGRVPSSDELSKYLGSKSANRKLELVNQLLGDGYVDDYAHNWSTLWTNILIGRTGGTGKKATISRPGLQFALKRAFQKNMTYDRLVYELIAADGVSKRGEKGFNGFVNFLAGHMADNGVEATARTAQIFLGIQVRCTQCHNHPFNDYKQNQFWEMNAFFRQTKVEQHFSVDGEGKKKKKALQFVELLNKDFAGEDKNPTEAMLFYELRNGKMAGALPVFVDGTPLPVRSGYVKDVNRRTELAKLMIRSDDLARAIVNRMWGHFLGYGFTKPVDDMGPHNPASHPELLDRLATELRTNSYDLKQLIRWIVLSEPYGLSSMTDAHNSKDDPAIGEKPMFSHFYLRQMRAEELYESLLLVTEAQKSKERQQDQQDLKEKWLSQFTVAFGTDDNEETTTFNGTIQQSLMMMNGELMRQAINIDKGGFLQRIASDARLNNPGKINALYLSALARKPTPSEIASANLLLMARHLDPAAALQDVWWAILNSNEFILNH
jgi:hypothetical protein